MDLVAEMGLGSGTTAVVGAGGKKSLIYQAASQIDRAVVTATVRIPPFDDQVAEVIRTTRPWAALDSVASWPVGLIPAAEESRYLGYEIEEVDEIASHPASEAVLVKADGARNREFKAPGEDEPKIPGAADRVLAVVSTQIVGAPLAEPHVHRPERIRAITGLSSGESIGVEDVATVLASPEGGRKNAPTGAELVPVLNKVDDTADEETARAIAERVLIRSPIDRVALTKLIDSGKPLVDIVE